MENTELLRLISKTGHRLHAIRGARPGQERILHMIGRSGEMTQKQLIGRMQLSQGTVSEMIQKLESRGLVEKKTDSSDKRRILLTLTEKGKKEEKTLRDRNDAEDAHVLDCLNEEEKDQLADMLKRILESWQNV
ncbi:MAG: MarR family transcriptional regulator [Bulleidia sp.]|nr:MarR family transcriptional regulator [Bulleidia sp.]